MIFREADGYKRDVARLAAAVVTGVGFLGAGAIIHRNAGITGLTTAATIWISMAIGLACGSMNFILAIGGTALILIVLVSLVGIERKLNKKGPIVTLVSEKNVPVISQLLEITQSSECRVFDLQIEARDNDEEAVTFILLANNRTFDIASVVSKLEAIKGVKSVNIKKQK